MKEKKKNEILDMSKSLMLYASCISVLVCLIIVYLATNNPDWIIFVMVLILVLEIVDIYISHERLKGLLEKIE